MKYKVFDNFMLEKKVSQQTIDKYQDKLPQELIEIWKQYGMGAILDGYIKLIDPEDFRNIVDRSYFRSKDCIPIIVTGFGDVITWEKSKYVGAVKYRKGKANIISSGFKYFFHNLIEDCFLEEDLEWYPYKEAIKIYGGLKYEECFGYVPLLGLGGAERVENIKKVRIREHIELITQLVGRIE